MQGPLVRDLHVVTRAVSSRTSLRIGERINLLENHMNGTNTRTGPVATTTFRLVSLVLSFAALALSGCASTNMASAMHGDLAHGQINEYDKPFQVDASAE